MNIILLTIASILFLSNITLVCCLAKRNNILNKQKMLNDIGKKIASNIKIKTLMKEIMKIVKEQVGAEACSLYLIDEEKQELWFEVALGEKGSKVKEIRLKMGEGIAGWVAQEGIKLNLKDVNNDPRFARNISKKIEHKQKSMLTLPIKIGSKTIGVIQLINKISGGFFNKSDEELMDGMCSQIAIALENAKLYKAMHDIFIDSMASLASAIDAKDPYTNGHSLRVTEYSLEIGREMKLSDEQLEKLEYMALLHDIGKIGISDSILNKQESLTDEEFLIMKTHTQIGEKILSSMKSLSHIIPGVKYHHERFDGSGYPSNCIGSDIPLEARIISIADTYDAMTTTRPYRKGLDHNTAIDEISKYSGTQFDPEIVEYFNAIMSKRTQSYDK